MSINPNDSNKSSQNLVIYVFPKGFGPPMVGEWSYSKVA